MEKDKPFSRLFFIYCILMPFEEAFGVSFGSINKIVGIIIIAYVFLRYRSIKIYSIYIPLIVWILYSILSVIWVSSTEWWWYFCKIYLLQIVFLLVVTSIPTEAIDFELIKKGIILAGVIASVILICFPAGSSLTEEGRRTIIMFGKVFDPNIIASIIMISVFVCLGDFFDKGRNSWQLIIPTCIGVVGILFTGSRGALISTVVGFVFQLFLRIKESGKKKKALLVIVLGIVATAVIIAYLPENLLMSRFSKETIIGLNELNGHNRYRIWGYALELFKANPLFGYGSGNFFSAMATVYRQCASHNLYILLLIETGLFGTILFMSVIVCIFKSLYRFRDYSDLSLLFSFLVMSLTLDAITYKYFWVMLIYVILRIINTEQEKKLQGA